MTLAATPEAKRPRAWPSSFGIPRASQNVAEADALYADRANLASARRAAQLWSADLARDPNQFDAAWKLSRIDYWLGRHASQAEGRQLFEQGIEAGRKASALEPSRPEGHFWTAANMGELAESYGMRQGIRYRTPIKQELETVLRIAPAYEAGSADRALGRWYARVPRLFGGSRKQAEEHLRASLKYNPNSALSHLFLAELFLDDGRKDEARRELQAVIDAPLDPNWTPEDREYKEKARKTLGSLK